MELQKPLFRVKLVLNSQVHKQTLVKPVMRGREKPTTGHRATFPASNASPAVSAITGALSNNPSLPGFDAQTRSGAIDSYGRPTGISSSQNATNATATSKADELYVEARNRYKEVQRVNVPPGGNVVLPVSRGLQNRISTSFKNASVSTSTPAEEASIFVNGGDVFISTNTDKPIGIILYRKIRYLNRPIT